MEPRALLVGDIAGLVWHDVNGNGFQENDEDGISGWEVYLDLDNDGGLDAGEPTNITDLEGEFKFRDLADGLYTVRETLPGGWTPTVGYSDWSVAEVIDGEETFVDFGNHIRQAGNIAGTVWNDQNGDALRAPGEPGLSGWTVYLDTNGNAAFDLDLNGDGVADDPEPSRLTSASGDYSFTYLDVGDYTVAEVLPAGWDTSEGYDVSQTVTVTHATTTTVDFANFTPEANTVSGVVWNDLDGDGARAFDPGTGEFTEPGLPGWTVYADLNGDGALTAGEPEALSNAAGAYTLYAVPYGTQSIREVIDPSWRPTAPASAAHVVLVFNGAAIDHLDFGNRERQEASVAGTVYVDTDRDGVRDPGERGLAGITIYLDLDNSGAMDPGEPRTVTAADQFFTPAVDETGSYSFTHLARGTYHLREIVPVELSATPAAEREKAVDLAATAVRTGVDFGNVFRPNEIHGVAFHDWNGNHQRDPGEPVLPGVTVFIDLDRDEAYDPGEPTTVTGADGSYHFYDLAPGAYVVRMILPDDHEHTYPSTVGGILWPEGTSHPAVGNVDPTSITTALAEGQSHRQLVSLTLPGSGSLTNLVDVFLLFDDTGSFTANSPIVRAAFPEIIATLQSTLPGIDLGFGVGRLEEYGNYAAEYAVGRPFVLNQPIVAAATSGFSAAIQAALDREAPGYGGDQPETVFEALYQTVTGVGFDGNDNGSLLDSGAAGLVATQLSPGASGDVPSFASFALDPGGAVLPPAGTLGGAGFRAGALPIILTATDTGFAYQPQGETSIVGLGGLTLPLSALTQASRPDTPRGAGAGIQQTITALNALGALVIGLGTNAEASLDPRQGLEAISRLTGATNQSAASVANGTADPIDPGDPFYFFIQSGFGGTVASGIVAAIQNAVTHVAVDITLRASDPRVHLVNHTGVLAGVTAGQTATFDVEFVGDGVPHRFDLQFVRAGTNVVLGSIPVVLGTPIPGDGYEFEDLEEGEIDDSADFGSRDIRNAAPSFVVGPAVTVDEDSGPQSISGWATSISPGPPEETGQALDFVVASDRPELFAAGPAISADGTLTFRPAADAFGTATVSVRLHDDGGTEHGGADTSLTQSFTITITDVRNAEVVGRHLFYNNSAFDGGNPAASAADDAAVASDKSALLPGQPANLANYSSYAKGINGLMVDVQGAPAGLSAADFNFATGNNNAVASWMPLSLAPSVALRPGAGIGGSTRVTLIWPDGAVTKRWLRVTLLAGAGTDLATDDVFYFGNAIGEVGNSTADAVVNATDEIAARTNPSGPFPTAPVTNLYDFNRDRLVNATDQIIARTNGTNPLTALRLISVPAQTGTGSAAAVDQALASSLGGDDVPASPSASRRKKR